MCYLEDLSYMPVNQIKAVSIIHPLLQLFPAFEKWQFLRSHFKAFPGHGIPALIGFIFFYEERT